MLPIGELQMLGGFLAAAAIEGGGLDDDRLQVVVAGRERGGADELRAQVVVVAVLAEVDLDADPLLRPEPFEVAGGFEYCSDTFGRAVRGHEVDDRAHSQTPATCAPQNGHLSFFSWFSTVVYPLRRMTIFPQDGQ